ncbi:MAG: hypothetical protein ACYC6L_05255 [Anaerolineae bacterium]
MPFADKFRAMMAMPFAGDLLGVFTVESISVGHEGQGFGYRYPVRLELRVPGGLEACKQAIKPLFKQKVTTFSGFGTPYHLWFGKPAVEKLGDDRYAVTGEGVGLPVRFEADLERFCTYLAAQGLLTCTPGEQSELVARYLKRYQAEIASQVGKYKRRAEKAAKAGPAA